MLYERSYPAWVAWVALGVIVGLIIFFIYFFGTTPRKDYFIKEVADSPTDSDEDAKPKGTKTKKNATLKYFLIALLVGLAVVLFYVIKYYREDT